MRWRNCQPYTMLPAARYKQWKTLDLVFSPLNFGGGMTARSRYRSDKFSKSPRAHGARQIMNLYCGSKSLPS